jgi:hypothetical protein
MSADNPSFDNNAGVKLVEQENLVQELHRLADLAERGELGCIGLRVFKSDGTWEDIVLGAENDDQRDAALELLQRRH